MSSSVVTVVIYAVRGTDTCTITRTITLNCDVPGANRPDANPGGSDGAISVFPNPTNGTVTVSSQVQQIATIEVIDARGNTIGNYNYSNKKQVEISLSDLVPGTYLFRINNTTSKVVTKLK